MKPKARKFYSLGPDSSKNPPGLIFENEKELRLPGIGIFGTGDVRVRGFPPLVEPPRFRYKKSLGRRPADLEQVLGYWIVSNKAKEVFEAIDPQAFAFAACQSAPKFDPGSASNFDPSHVGLNGASVALALA